MSYYEGRLLTGEAYMMCNDCGARLYSFDGNKDKGIDCPKKKSNGKCGYDD